MSDFVKEIKAVIDKYQQDGGSPSDFVLGEYLLGGLEAFTFSETIPIEGANNVNASDQADNLAGEG